MIAYLLVTALGSVSLFLLYVQRKGRMGNNPIPPARRPTVLDTLREQYVRGALDLDEFELRVGEVLRAGTADDPQPIPPSILNTALATNAVGLSSEGRYVAGCGMVVVPTKAATPTESLR